MIAAFLVIAVLNFCVGFALAVTLRIRGGGPAYAPRPIITNPDKKTKTRPSKPVAAVSTENTEHEKHAEEAREELLSKLEDAVESKAFVEAAVEVLKLEVDKYRERLIQIDRQVRESGEQGDAEKISGCLADLDRCNAEWLAQQQAAVEHLQKRQDSLGDFSGVGNGLEDVLLEQAAQIETTCSNIAMLDFGTDVAAGCRRMVTETCRLLDLAHSLRDQMMESFVTILSVDDQLASIDPKLQYDAGTEVLNRTGLERMMVNLWRDDPNRVRQISIGLVDIDRFAPVNERFGARHGDHLLRGFGKLLIDVLNSDRAGDTVTRLAGQRYLLVFPDTGPRAATSSMERIRQTVQQTTFYYDDQPLELTVSCGVVEARTDDTTSSLFDRAAKTVREAKWAGRNRTFMHNGREPNAVEPPIFEVKGREVQLYR